ncbi:MAG: helix-turn-helix domain-containing protein, partial [bacterium]
MVLQPVHSAKNHRFVLVEERMRRKNFLVRQFRAISGESQKSFARRAGVNPVTLAQYELGQADPSPD